MKKINFIFVFLAITLAIDIIIPFTIPQVNHGTGFVLFIMLAIGLGFTSVIAGRILNSYFKNQ